MGVKGLQPFTGATAGNTEEAAVKALILSRSTVTIVLASREKLGSASPYLSSATTEFRPSFVGKPRPPRSRALWAQQGPT